ncbi:unnamed protein product [Orchesella dallaii]|uniref:Uncharacterized protein n=1 Tax=Orchesella dallaii TaxID=48710 RepID=A0ABP1Q0J3_9HEXA
MEPNQDGSDGKGGANDSPVVSTSSSPLTISPLSTPRTVFPEANQEPVNLILGSNSPPPLINNADYYSNNSSSNVDVFPVSPPSQRLTSTCTSRSNGLRSPSPCGTPEVVTLSPSCSSSSSTSWSQQQIPQTENRKRIRSLDIPSPPKKRLSFTQPSSSPSHSCDDDDVTPIFTPTPFPSDEDEDSSISPSGVEEDSSASPSGDEEDSSPSPSGDEEDSSPSPSGDEEDSFPSPSGDEEDSYPSPSGDEAVSVSSSVDDTTPSGLPKLDPLSLHRLCLRELRRQPVAQVTPHNERQLIENFMDNINKKYKNPMSVYKIVTPSPPEGHRPGRAKSTFIPFATLTYVQTVTSASKFLRHLRIPQTPEITTHRTNIITFYYRTGQIFAATQGNGWQVIKNVSCYKFPHIISGRIATSEGNLRESLHPLTGNAKITSVTRQNAQLFDKLKNIRCLTSKKIRQNSSIYNLSWFSDKEGNLIGSKERITLTLGMAYIRIERRMSDAAHQLPELFDYFSKIYKKAKTYSFPEGEEEVDSQDDYPWIVGTSESQKQKCEGQLFNRLFDYLGDLDANEGRLSGLDLCESPKYLNSFITANRFVLKYLREKIATFVRLPTLLDCCEAMRKNEKLKGLDSEKFPVEIKKVKLQYDSGRGSPLERPLVDLLEGEIILEGVTYIKLLRHWFKLDKYYHTKLHRMFLELLNKEGLFLTDKEPGFLHRLWNPEVMNSVSDYTRTYEGENLFFVPVKRELEQEDEVRKEDDDVSQQIPRADGKHDVNERESQRAPQPKNKFFLDLIHVLLGDHEPHSIYLYFIFDRFDPTIRGASTRLETCLGMLKRDEKLKDLYTTLVTYPNFLQLFPSYQDFKKIFRGKGKVTVVAAFRTSSVVKCRQEGMIREQRSLEEEKNLELFFNHGNITKLIVEPCENMACDLLNITHEVFAAEVERYLLDPLNGWCLAIQQGDAPVSAKLLTQRNREEFKVFGNQQVDYKLFQCVRRHFITKFPGISHKLECDSMRQTTLALSSSLGLDFKIMEILDEEVELESVGEKDSESEELESEDNVSEGEDM